MSVMSHLIYNTLKIRYKIYFSYLSDQAYFEKIGKDLKKVNKLIGYRFQNAPVQIEEEVLAGVPCRWITPEPCKNFGVLVYLHGGGYNAGEWQTYQNFLISLALQNQRKILFIEYTTSNIAPFPAALNDVVKAIAVLQQQEIPYVLAGDSAGGALALATLAYLKDHQQALPKGVIGFCPWLDLTTKDADKLLQQKDPALRTSLLNTLAQIYCGEERADHPYISPAYGEYTAMPPIFIQAGEYDLLTPDIESFYQKAKKEGWPVHLKVWPRLWHVWHLATHMRESKDAIAEAIEYLDKMMD